MSNNTQQEREKRLRDAAKSDAITSYSGTKESDYVMAVSENTFIRAIKSEAAKQYHQPDNNVKIISQIKSFLLIISNYLRGEHNHETDSIQKKEDNELLNKCEELILILSNPTPPKALSEDCQQLTKESDAVEFLKYINDNYYRISDKYVHNNWSGNLDELNTHTEIELYQLFLNRNK